MMRKNVKPRPYGLTLIELVVVMAVLVALAAVLIPSLPQLVGQANQASGVTNIVDVDKLMQTYFATHSAYPDKYDSLLDEGATISTLLPTPEGSGGTAVGGWVVQGAIDAGQLARLQRVGITAVCDFAGSTAAHATLYPYGATDSVAPTARTLAADGKVAVLGKKSASYAGAISGVQLDDTHTYVVVGIGNPCTLCGMDGQLREAPMYRHHKAITTPDETYQRLCAVFDVGPTGTTGKGADAKLVAVVGLKGQKLSPANEVLGSYGSSDSAPSYN
jgi:prepilin-type N-terminal cleavage/methylation domain-containing protein